MGTRSGWAEVPTHVHNDHVVAIHMVNEVLVTQPPELPPLRGRGSPRGKSLHKYMSCSTACADIRATRCLPFADLGLLAARCQYCAMSSPGLVELNDHSTLYDVWISTVAVTLRQVAT